MHAASAARMPDGMFCFTVSATLRIANSSSTSQAPRVYAQAGRPGRLGGLAKAQVAGRFLTVCMLPMQYACEVVGPAHSPCQSKDCQLKQDINSGNTSQAPRLYAQAGRPGRLGGLAEAQVASSFSSEKEEKGGPSLRARGSSPRPPRCETSESQAPDLASSHNPLTMLFSRCKYSSGPEAAPS